MNSKPTNLAGLTPAECVRLLVEYRQKWLLTTAVCVALALGYALIMPRYWEATQGLVVRREASANGNEPGKFADLYEMRTFQETVLELAKSPQVITATLQAVDGVTQTTDKDIEKLRKRLSLLPPGGAEFGKTEVCYLQVKDTERQRAIRLVAELGQQVDHRLRQLRKQQSQSLSAELHQQVDRAQQALDVETERLAQFEAEVGADLGELRMLNASNSGQSDLRQQAVNLNNERRTAELKVRESEQLLSVLELALEEPEQLIAMPNSLLESQPTLRRLKDGLVDAQLRAARLASTRTAEHPQVLAAREAVERIRHDLYGELNVAIRGVDVEQNLSSNRVANLQTQYEAVQQRLGRLAGLRADYANRMSAVENSRNVLDRAQKQLGEVESKLVASHSASLVTAIDQPETGPYPGGVGRTSVVLFGTFAGVALGLGWVFLIASPDPITARKALFEVRDTTMQNGSRSNGATTARKVPNNLTPETAKKLAEIIANRKERLANQPRF